MAVLGLVHRAGYSCRRNPAAACRSLAACVGGQGETLQLGSFLLSPATLLPAHPLRLWKLCLVSVSPKINNRSQREEMSQSIHQRQEQSAVIQEAKFRL